MSPIDWLKYCLAKARQNPPRSMCLTMHLSVYLSIFEYIQLIENISLSLSLSLSSPSTVAKAPSRRNAPVPISQGKTARSYPPMSMTSWPANLSGGLRTQCFGGLDVSVMKLSAPPRAKQVPRRISKNPANLAFGVLGCRNFRGFGELKA